MTKKEVIENHGLDHLEDRVFNLKKLSSKKVSPYGYPDCFDVITGNIMWHEYDDFVWASFVSDSSWYKISPFIEITKKGNNCWLIETENSIYQLLEVEKE